MRFVICCDREVAPRAVKAGFDYVELPAQGFLGREPNYEGNPYSGLPVEVTNLFFPAEIRLIGPQASDYRPYVERTVRRAAEAGVRAMVIGSGGSRKAPEGMDVDEAELEFAKIARFVQDQASPHGIAIAPESLNREETNVGNDLATLAHLLRAQGIGYTADSYHVLREWHADPRGAAAPLWTEQLPFPPEHVHLADLPRHVPAPDDPLLAGFVHRLRTLGYDGRVSLEAKIPDDSVEGLRHALSHVRMLFEEA